MWAQLKKQPPVGKLMARFDQLPARDRQALIVLAVALLLAILYFMIWRPAAGFHERAVSERENARELLAWMQSNQEAIQSLSANRTSDSGSSATRDRPADGRALMALVTRTAREAELSLQRFEPSGEDAIRVWLEPASFGQVAAWLEQLAATNGVQVDQAAMDRSDKPGIVSARLTLTI